MSLLAPRLFQEGSNTLQDGVNTTMNAQKASKDIVEAYRLHTRGCRRKIRTGLEAHSAGGDVAEKLGSDFRHTLDADASPKN